MQYGNPDDEKNKLYFSGTKKGLGTDKKIIFERYTCQPAVSRLIYEKLQGVHIIAVQEIAAGSGFVSVLQNTFLFLEQTIFRLCRTQ